MLRTVVKAGLAVQVGHLYKRRNAERSSEHLTRRARPIRASALLHALRRVPPCAASRAAPKPLSRHAESTTTFSTGC